ncbi:hypothetical protein [uncultured Mucilaginibacter sp.]|uniref:hypothetical protein n=1 Tax=uncultured Mucilaginibacter sp. TaxID=797541 RepID=UPI0025FBAE97|nr:hypothetical protein [uncultured Mucilaginibacter sp.]
MLFVKGIFNESGDVDASFKNYKLTVKKAAPGTFFVLFGAIIICFTIFNAIDLKSGVGPPIDQTTTPPVLKDSVNLK